jgi:hypothetical protein
MSGIDLVNDLLVGELLRGSKQTVAPLFTTTSIRLK